MGRPTIDGRQTEHRDRRNETGELLSSQVEGKSRQKGEIKHQQRGAASNSAKRTKKRENRCKKNNTKTLNRKQNRRLNIISTLVECFKCFEIRFFKIWRRQRQSDKSTGQYMHFPFGFRRPPILYGHKHLVSVNQ